ncbi:hypothetical protein C8A05DRAFT_33631 [Staphylotrichum tortipilum]|uniref:RING-type domain-containing protein n=1 Tax=Staphylotrichum tortipilum TaxID=2831512 RepID=A0AAN6MKM2_9PEZI|nr:hypothetical protein C8A05DRAFT_33631 [Staphylotrichum longicolle]
MARASPPASPPSLEAELTCSICTDLLYQPLTLLDCLHTFCGACLKEWFRFQAARIESSPLPPPPPSVPIFTCPSCREAVRDTRHDARVASLLDMFLALNPGKGKSEEEKREMDGRYVKGERVMPRVERVEGRSEEERRLDERERELLEEVQRVSLREATERAAGVVGGGGSGGRSREGSRVRGERRGRARSEGLRVEGGASGEGRRTSRQRSESRQVEHQSSLRSLIRTEGGDDAPRDIGREIEEFARQIQEEGLLDGLDLNNLDLENNDELSRRITDAYRRRHRERRRDEAGRRSNASARSDVPQPPPSPRARDPASSSSSRPTSRHPPRSRSRAPSANASGDERDRDRERYPPSSSARLEVQDAPRRRRASSGSRSATLPVAPTQPETRVSSRAQTDLATRPRASDSHVAAQGLAAPADPRGSTASAPAAVSSSGGSADRGLPFSARAAEGGRQQQRPEQPPPLDVRPESPTLGLSSPPISPVVLASPAFSSPRRSQQQAQPPPPRYKEPHLTCATCSRDHIEYDLHFNCAVCHGGEWNICLDCWRRRRGCLHWFGFGAAAWAKWEKVNLASGGVEPPPHMLTANRYLRPRKTASGASGNPLERLQSGTFCARCEAWTNECYWRCDVCNEGEWGFCNGCVNRGACCTHPLLPLAYRPPAPSPPTTTPSHSHSLSNTSAHSHSPSTTTPPGTLPPAAPGTTTPPRGGVVGGIGNFHPTPPHPHCAACRLPIPPSTPHHHCPSCPSPPRPHPDEDPSAPDAGYNLCSGCYTALCSPPSHPSTSPPGTAFAFTPPDGAGGGGGGMIAAENGPSGWRRCPRGHRMVVVGYVVVDGGQVRRRVVLGEVVGGRGLKFAEYNGPAGLVEGVRVCSWRDGEGRERERLWGVDVRVDTTALGVGKGFEAGFPGEGERVVAGWGWVPEVGGGEDELMFPKGAEIGEVEDMNGEWFHGWYMGRQGLFPAPYVRRVGGAGMI